MLFTALNQMATGGMCENKENLGFPSEIPLRILEVLSSPHPGSVVLLTTTYAVGNTRGSRAHDRSSLYKGSPYGEPH